MTYRMVLAVSRALHTPALALSERAASIDYSFEQKTQKSTKNDELLSEAKCTVSPQCEGGGAK